MDFVPYTTFEHKLDYLIFLIKQELTTRLFLKTLHSAGIHHITIQFRVDKLILEALALDPTDPQTLQRYEAIMNEELAMITHTFNSIIMRSMFVYMKLKSFKEQQTEAQ